MVGGKNKLVDLTNHFFNKISERFLHQPERQTPTENEPDQRVLLKVPFADKISKDFFNNIRLIIKRKFGIHVMPLYATTKVGHYFQLKSQTPSSLRSDVYKFTCSRDVSTTYIGTSSRHLSVRFKEHLSKSASNKSAIKELIRNCSSCSQEQDLNSITVIRKCNTAYEAQIQEALLIKKQNPKSKQAIIRKWSIIFTKCIFFMLYCLL